MSSALAGIFALWSTYVLAVWIVFVGCMTAWAAQTVINHYANKGSS